MKRTLVMVALAAALGGSAAFVACGSSDSGGTTTSKDVTMADGTSLVDFAVNSLKLPTSRDHFSIDLDGNGVPDNQLAQIINVIAGALSGKGPTVQDGVDKSVTGGQVIILAEIQTADPALQKDDAMSVTVYAGKKFSCTVDDAGQATDGGICPDFNGMGMFSVDSSNGSMPAQFFGKLAGGKFSSNNPATTTHPVSLTLRLALVDNAPAINLNTNGAHIMFPIAGGKIGDAKLCSVDNEAPCGSLQGSVKIKDIQDNVIPTVATFLTQKVMGPGCDSTCMSVEMLFDNGGCSDLVNGVMVPAVAMDKKVTACEVAGAPIIANLLAADIQVFDSNGNYKPNPTKTNKDSLSLGVGFTAVPAKIMK